MPSEETKPATIEVHGYGDMFAQVKDMELIHYEEFGSYQGDYIVICRDKTETYGGDRDRVFIWTGGYGSCSGCDWLEAELEYEGEDYNKRVVGYAKAVEYCNVQPYLILPTAQVNHLDAQGVRDLFKGLDIWGEEDANWVAISQALSKVVVEPKKEEADE